MAANSSVYEMKYLKYKMKYLQLKKLLGGMSMRPRSNAISGSDAYSQPGPYVAPYVNNCADHDNDKKMCEKSTRCTYEDKTQECVNKPKANYG